MCCGSFCEGRGKRALETGVLNRLGKSGGRAVRRKGALEGQGGLAFGATPCHRVRGRRS